MVFTRVFHGTFKTFYCNSYYKLGLSEILRSQKMFVKEIVNFVVAVNIFIKKYSCGLVSKPYFLVAEGGSRRLVKIKRTERRMMMNLQIWKLEGQ